MAGERWRFLVDETLGFAIASYLRLVRATNRFTRVPADVDALIAGRTPVIVAMWHGQHLMTTFAWPRTIMRMAALISRHPDAGIQAVALRHLGVDAVRGSGGRAHRSREKGGGPALIALKRYLEQGVSVAMTADVPKWPRTAGLGILTLAKHTRAPIAPTAVVCSRRIDTKSWDRASLGLPFGRAVVVVADLIEVPLDADNEALEAIRLKLENVLDATYARAYALVGAKDPGAELRGT